MILNELQSASECLFCLYEVVLFEQLNVVVNHSVSIVIYFLRSRQSIHAVVYGCFLVVVVVFI